MCGNTVGDLGLGWTCFGLFLDLMVIMLNKFTGNYLELMLPVNFNKAIHHCKSNE